VTYLMEHGFDHFLTVEMKNQLENQLDFSFRQKVIAKKKTKSLKKKHEFTATIGYREISA
jgi:predicted glycosyltransferase